MSIVICEDCSCMIDLDVEDCYSNSDDGHYLCPRCSEEPNDIFDDEMTKVEEAFIDKHHNTFVLNKDITAKTLTKRYLFDKLYWVLLPQKIQLYRMVRLATNLLNADDTWADKEMLIRRNRRNFISPRIKTDRSWRVSNKW